MFPIDNNKSSTYPVGGRCTHFAEFFGSENLYALRRHPGGHASEANNTTKMENFH